MRVGAILLLGTIVAVQGCGTPAGPPVVATAPRARPRPATFRQVLKVLQARCVSCHSTAEYKLDYGVPSVALDSYAAVMRGQKEGPVVRRGDPKSSLLIRSLRGTGDALVMPPGGRPRVAEDDIDLIERWIRFGAKNN